MRSLACRIIRQLVLGFYASLSFYKLLLDLHCSFAQAAVASAQKPSVNTTIMFNGADSVCGQAQRNGFAQYFRWERANLQIRLPAAARSVVCVADIVAKKRLFAVNGAYSGHDLTSGISPILNKCFVSRINASSAVL